ncbi:DNA polymerase phi-domain-containing protein [Gloeopeniophorella convolvens]|nr:DNA polymerase phi-domain-containing protein [Gloeopeniophorella convolvens]
MSTTLPLFWDLSSADKKKRIDASAKLVGTLQKFQAAFVPKPGAATGAAESDETSGEEEDGDEDGGRPHKTEDEVLIDALNAPDVAYSIRRLVRGLASPRESSRLGFAVALTELLSRITTVSSAQVLALVLDASRVSGSLSGQEERDLLLARLFGLAALVHSGLLLRTAPPLPHSATPPSTLAACTDALGALPELARAKSWLAEAAYRVLCAALDALAAASADLSWRDEAVRAVLEAEFGEAGGAWTPERVALALRAQRLWPEREAEWRRMWAPAIKHGNVLHSANLAALAKVLRESGVEDDEDVVKASGRTWKPQVHFVWDDILDELLPPKDSGRTPKGSFQEFFRIVVDESLFAGSASNERKYWGFVIFQRALSRVKAADLPMLFTKNFMRTWINHLSHFDRYLHSFAKQIATSILAAVQKDPALGFAFILQLTGVHGNQQFDKLTKTKTVESILTTMNAEGIASYIQHLLAQVDEDSSSAQPDIQVINARRAWIVEQFAALVRHGAIPKDDGWVQVILDWLVVHGIFIVKKKSPKSPFSAVCSLRIPAIVLPNANVQVQSPPSPPFSDGLREQCRERLLSCLADLTQLSVVTKTADDKTQKLTGAASDGEFWISRVLQTIQQLEQDTKHVKLAAEFDEDELEKLEQARKAIASLKKVQVQDDRKESARGAELLLQSFILLLYTEESPEQRDTAPLEVISCTDGASRLFPESPKKTKKHIEPAEDEKPEPEPIDVLVDTIIGCLEKGTAYMRAVSNHGFSLLSAAVKDSTVDLILAQLERRDPSELVADSDEEMDVDEDEDAEGGSEDDDADSSSSGDIDDSESEEGNEEENEELRKKITEALRANGIEAATGLSDDESEEDLDDDQMMAMDEQLAQIFKDRARGKGKEEGAQREATHFKNRVLDLLDVFIKRQPTSPLILRLLVPLLALTTSDEKQLSEKAAGLLKSRISKLKEVPTVLDAAEATAALEDLHIRARKVHAHDALAAISHCSLYVARALLHTGADAPVLAAYTASLVDFTERKASNLNANFFTEFVKRHPSAAWGMRSALLAAPGKAVNVYRQGQAYLLLQTLLNHLPPPEDGGLEEVATFTRELQEALHGVLSAACDADTAPAANLKESLKLALVGTRTTKRLAAKSEAAARVLAGTWDAALWEGLHGRLAAHPRFKSLGALLGMCKQVAQLAQAQASSEKKPTKRAEKEGGKVKEKAAKSKRKAEAEAEAGAVAPTVKKAKRRKSAAKDAE